MARRRIAPDARGGARESAGATHPRGRAGAAGRARGRLDPCCSRSAPPTLKDHAGQISFPGDASNPATRIRGGRRLREAHEEIGLSASFVEFAGYMPDHWVGTGFRVTPVVAFVNPAFELKIAAAEVHDAFEVPLRFILDAPITSPASFAWRISRCRSTTFPMASASSGGRPPACLMTFRRLLQARQAALTGGAPRRGEAS